MKRKIKSGKIYNLRKSVWEVMRYGDEQKKGVKRECGVCHIRFHGCGLWKGEKN